MKFALYAIFAALPSWGVTAVIYSDLAANLVDNRAWIKDHPTYGFWSYGSAWTNRLDCTGSTGASMGIASCDWSRLSGPSSLIFGSPNGTTTTVTGVTFGTYVIQVVVHDGAGNTDTTTQTIGASQCDSSGVLIPRDANFTKFFDQQVCMGRNSWGLSDETHLRALLARKSVYNTNLAYGSSYTYGNPDFANPQTGSVSWYWAGRGNAYGTAGTTLSAGSNSTATSLNVANASNLNLTAFPTRIMIQASGSITGPFEEIRISESIATSDTCGTGAAPVTSGAAKLCVAYDGRSPAGSGSFWTDRGWTNYTAAQSWSMGDLVGQQLVKGTTTSFLSTLNTGGAGCPTGPILYSTGTAGLTASSDQMSAGGGASWAGNVAVGDAVCVTAAHSATPFKFVAWVTNVSTALTLSRVFPATGDTATGLTYRVIKTFNRYIVPGFDRPSPYSGTGTTKLMSTGCESDIQCFFNIGLFLGFSDVTLMNNSGPITGTYSYTDVETILSIYSQGSNGGLNFYGENLAWISLLERSGLDDAATMAAQVSAPWLNGPVYNGGLSGYGSPLFYGGGVIGATAHSVLYGSPTMADLRPWFTLGVQVGSASCDGGLDTREAGYLATFPVLGAVHDTNSGTDAPGGLSWRSYWRTFVGTGTGTIYFRQNACKRSNGGVDTNSWANGYINNTNAVTVGVTNGNTAVTGTGFTSGRCQGIEAGTANVISGSNVVTTGSTFSATAGSIQLGSRYFQFSRTNSTTGVISSLWPGSTGTISFMTLAPILTSDAAPNQTSYMSSASDDSGKQQYNCIFNSSTSLTLDRNFAGTTGSKQQSENNLTGYGQQPFMLGIQNTQFKYGKELDAAIGTDFTGLSAGAATWLWTYGFDPNTQAIYYGRVFGNCESGGSIGGVVESFIWTIPACGTGNLVTYAVAYRQLNQEGFSGITQYYENNLSAPNKSTADGLYGAIWDKTGWNAAGSPNNLDSVGNNLGMSNLTDIQLAQGKYPGQIFGMGFAPTWPAVRSGSAPPVEALGVAISGPVSIRGNVVIR